MLFSVLITLYTFFVLKIGHLKFIKKKIQDLKLKTLEWYKLGFKYPPFLSHESKKSLFNNFI